MAGIATSRDRHALQGDLLQRAGPASDRRHHDQRLAGHGGLGALGPVAVYLGMPQAAVARAELVEEHLRAREEAAAAQELAEEIGMSLVACRAAGLVLE